MFLFNKLMFKKFNFLINAFIITIILSAVTFFSSCDIVDEFTSDSNINEPAYELAQNCYALKTVDDNKFLISESDTRYILADVNVESAEKFFLKPSMLGEFILYDRIIIEYAFLWLYYGFMIIMIFYNFFLFISIKDKSYIFYVLFISTYVITQLIFNGFANQYLWSHFQFWNEFTLFSSISAFSLMMFFKYYVQIKKYNYKLDKLLSILAFINLSFAIIISFVSKFFLSHYYYQTCMLVITVLQFLSVTLILVIAFVLALKKNRQARFFFISFLFLILGIVFRELLTFNMVPLNNFTKYSLQIASVFTVIILSLGLADKINVLSNDLKVLNENLEKKVKERTFQLNERKNELEKELDLAQKIQQDLIPSHNPAEYISAYYKPMQKVGGDFYDFLKFRDSDKIGIFISDVSGHGVPAAFITSMLKTIILQSGPIKENPSELLLHINKILQKHTAGKYVTAFYGIYNPSDRTLFFSNAGHNQPYIIHDNISELHGGKNTAIAMFPNNMLEISNKTFQN